MDKNKTEKPKNKCGRSKLIVLTQAKRGSGKMSQSHRSLQPEVQLHRARILKKNPDIVTRTFDKETILMPLYKTSEDIDCIYTLDEIGARIWELIDGKRTLGKIQKILLREFEVTEDLLDKELPEFFKDLYQIKAVVCKN